MMMSRSSRFGYVQWLCVALLAVAGMGMSGCFGIGGGGGGITPTPTFLNGTFKSEQGKIFVLAEDGSYQFFPSEEKQSSNEPELNSKYEVLDKNIVFERADGSKFSEPAKLSEDGKSFTWAEYPGETFTKVEG